MIARGSRERPARRSRRRALLVSAYRTSQPERESAHQVQRVAFRHRTKSTLLQARSHGKAKEGAVAIGQRRLRGVVESLHRHLDTSWVIFTRLAVGSVGGQDCPPRAQSRGQAPVEGSSAEDGGAGHAVVRRVASGMTAIRFAPVSAMNSEPSRQVRGPSARPPAPWSWSAPEALTNGGFGGHHRSRAAVHGKAEADDRPPFTTLGARGHRAVQKHC